MRPRVLSALILAGFVFAGGAEASDKLVKPYSMEVGEGVALTVPQLLTLLGEDRPVLAVYDKTDQTIDIYVRGIWSSADQAKADLEKLRAKLDGPLLGLLSNTYALTLDDSDFTLVYYHGD